MSEEVGLRNDTRSLIQLKTVKLTCMGEVILVVEGVSEEVIEAPVLKAEVLLEDSEIEEEVGLEMTEWLLTQHVVIAEISEAEMIEVVDSHQEVGEAL